MVSCVTADSFFHFDIYRTRKIARAGPTQGWWRPVFCSWQQTAPAASKEQTRSFTASGNLKINLSEIFSQLSWVENSFMPGGKKVCRSCFSFSPLSLGFATIILSILDTCIKSWIFLTATKLLAIMVYCSKDRWIEIGVKHHVLVSKGNDKVCHLPVSASLLWFVVYLLLYLFPF